MSREIEITDGGTGDTVRTITLGGFMARIIQDEDAESPREWDNLGTMVCGNRRYNLGDKDPGYKTKDFDGWAGMAAAIMRDHPGCVILPLFLYDHSGITMRTNPFNCPWDSGQVGFIFASAEKIRKEWNCKQIRKPIRDKVIASLECEVATYDMHLRGDCYGYIIENEAGEELDSCWGFLGMDHITSEVSEQLRHFEKEAA